MLKINKQFIWLTVIIFALSLFAATSCKDESDLPSSEGTNKTDSTAKEDTKKDDDDKVVVTAPISDEYGLWKRVAADQSFRIYSKKIVWQEKNKTVEAKFKKLDEDENYIFKVDNTRELILNYTGPNQASLQDDDKIYILNRYGINNGKMTGRLVIKSGPSEEVSPQTSDDENYIAIPTQKDSEQFNDYSKVKVKLVNPENNSVVIAVVKPDGTWEADNLQTGIEYEVVIEIEGKQAQTAELVHSEEITRDQISFNTTSESEQTNTGTVTVYQNIPYSFRAEIKDEENDYYFSENEYTAKLEIENIGTEKASGAYYYITTIDGGIEFLEGHYGIIGTLESREKADPIDVKFKVKSIRSEKRTLRLQVIISAERINIFINEIDLTVYGSAMLVNLARKATLSSTGNLMGFIIGEDRKLVRFSHNVDWDYELGSSGIKNITLPCLTGDNAHQYIMVISASEGLNESAYSFGIHAEPDPSLETFINTSEDETPNPDGTVGNDTEAQATKLQPLTNVRGFISHGTVDYYKYSCTDTIAGTKLQLTEIENEMINPPEDIDPANAYFDINVKSKIKVNNYGTVSQPSLSSTDGFITVAVGETAGTVEGNPPGIMQFGTVKQIQTACGITTEDEAKFGSCDSAMTSYLTITPPSQAAQYYASGNFYLNLTFDIQLTDLLLNTYRITGITSDDQETPDVNENIIGASFTVTPPELSITLASPPPAPESSDAPPPIDWCLPGRWDVLKAQVGLEVQCDAEDTNCNTNIDQDFATKGFAFYRTTQTAVEERDDLERLALRACIKSTYDANDDPEVEDMQNTGIDDTVIPEDATIKTFVWFYNQAWTPIAYLGNQQQIRAFNEDNKPFHPSYTPVNEIDVGETIEKAKLTSFYDGPGSADVEFQILNWYVTKPQMETFYYMVFGVVVTPTEGAEFMLRTKGYPGILLGQGM